MVDLKKWNAMPTHIKMLNIGSEVNRVINLHAKNSQYLHSTLDTALELIDATMISKISTGGKRELGRMRELICAIVYMNDTRNNTNIKRYFNSFGNVHVAGSSVTLGHGVLTN